VATGEAQQGQRTARAGRRIAAEVERRDARRRGRGQDRFHAAEASAEPLDTLGGMAAAIEIIDLRKSYGSVHAVDGVTLEAQEGTVLGLLGPNGAGKTTIVRILATLLPADGGQARVAGIDVFADPGELRRHIGLAGQYAAVDEQLTGEENLELFARLYGYGRAEAKRRTAALLERFDLVDAGGKVVSNYSGGMRRRLDLAAALLAEPPVVFLDEPTTGLDPRSRLALWETIEERVAAGTTVLLTTQYLDEADRLADRIAVIDHGRVIAEGTAAELKARVGGDRLEVRLGSGADPQAAIAALAPMATEPPEAHDAVVRAPVPERPGVLPEAVRRLDDAGVQIVDLSVGRPTLDDVFLRLTGHAAEDAADDEEAA
jgi:ABC-2 type transport system ATP-binding protein